ncbi:MAG: HD domain-containing protein [Anaerolineae bacterium]|nr:HD domain-containing protein [Anaerolineae bacterium]
MTYQSADHAAMAALLDGLLVGARRDMTTIGDWADHLLESDPSPLVSEFVNALGDEWFDALPPDTLCETVTGQARGRLSAWHPGWPHLWAHVQRVTGVAVALAEEAGVDPVLAYLMGICHDVAKLDEFRTGEPHEDVGADFVGEVLRGHLRPAAIETIQAAILKDGDDDLAEILHDADKLDKIGAAGVLRRISSDTRPGWVPVALDRVAEDAARFPAMHFDLSADLARSKQLFLAGFLPLAFDAAADW